MLGFLFQEYDISSNNSGEHPGLLHVYYIDFAYSFVKYIWRLHLIIIVNGNFTSIITSHGVCTYEPYLFLHINFISH